mmetsp:Transcript_25423/g.74662  ORF Transcript_25423/g.74662 Transcript_25423/m.74662 type:complete len:291 (-) Transcript_25423:69-941(-)
MGTMHSTSIFAENPYTVCVVYPWTVDEMCATCAANEWSYHRPVSGFGPTVLPRQLEDRVSVELWERLLRDCYDATNLDYLYYKYGFSSMLVLGVLLLLVLAPTAGLIAGGPTCIGIFLTMAVASKVVARKLDKKLHTIVQEHGRDFAAAGCALAWRQAWVGGIESVSRFVWIEVVVYQRVAVSAVGDEEAEAARADDERPPPVSRAWVVDAPAIQTLGDASSSAMEITPAAVEEETRDAEVGDTERVYRTRDAVEQMPPRGPPGTIELAARPPLRTGMSVESAGSTDHIR